MAAEHRLEWEPSPIPHFAEPLVGRGAALGAIRERLERARQGQGGGLALEGASGVGKTRLVWETIGAARQAGVADIYLPCRGSRQHPYAPLIRLAQALLGVGAQASYEARLAQVQRALSALMLGDVAPTLLNLLDLCVLPPPASLASPRGTSVPVAADLARSLLRLIRAWVRRGAAAQPLLLAFDDLDQASDITVQVFHALLRGIRDLPILLMATYAPEAPRDLHLAFKEHQVIELFDLPRSEARALAAALLDAPDLSRELAALLWKRTMGRPAFVALAVRHLAGAGSLVREGLAEHVGIRGASDVPEIRAILADQVERLMPGPRETLLAASVLESGLTADALLALRGGQAQAVVTADLESLVAGGWLQADDTLSARCYRFPIHALWGLLYSSIPGDMLAVWHMRAGDYWAVQAGGCGLQTEIAVQHYLRAGSPVQALATIERAIVEARRAGDHDRLAALLRRGAVVARSDAALAGRQAELAEALGDLHASVGDYESAARAYRELSPSDGPAALQGKLGLALLPADPERAARVLRRAVQAIPPDHPHDLRWWLEAGHIWALALIDRHYEAVRLSRDALAQLGSTAGLGAARTLLQAMLGMVLYYQGEQAEGISHLWSARSGWEARGDRASVQLVDQILRGCSRHEATQRWLGLALAPLIGPADR